MSDNPRSPLTHTAFIFKREGKRPNQGRWLECGMGRIEQDGKVNVYLDRLPVGGFSGRVHLVKVGEKPPAPEPEQPARPFGDHGDGEEEPEG
jgi:hypothetical protein